MLPSLLDRTERTLERPGRRRPSPAAELTVRELALLRLLPTKLSQPEIAQELYLSVNTVRTHIQGLYRKLEVTSRAEAVDKARQLGLIHQRRPSQHQPDTPCPLRPPQRPYGVDLRSEAGAIEGSLPQSSCVAADLLARLDVG